MNKCIGCGIIMQSDDSNKEGYTKSADSNLCERCFRIKNYNDYKIIPRTNNDFLPIMQTIKASGDLVVLVIDILNIPHNLDLIKNNLDNDILLVFSKRDILPADLYEEYLLQVADAIGINYVDKLFVSSNKNYQFDLLHNMINKYKKSKNVYIVGYTNAGKSTMINKLIYNYSGLDYVLTTSPLPSTTLDLLNINLSEDLTLIDTPGLIEEGNIVDYLDNKDIKKIANVKTIKPKVYQIKSEQTLRIDKFLGIICDNNNLVLYLPNSFNIERFYKRLNFHLDKYIFDIKGPSDIVIPGLGFIKVMKKGKVEIYSYSKVNIYIRQSIIN